MGIPLNDRLADDMPSDDVRHKIRTYIRDNILLGLPQNLDDGTSLLEAGILDSTGAMEMVAFLEEEFAIVMDDEDIVADNLDSIDRICAFVARKRA